MDGQERAREWRATLRSRPPPPFTQESWGLFLDYARLWRLCPDLHRHSLHWLLCACGGSLARAVDNVLLARRLRQRCVAWRGAGRGPRRGAPYARPAPATATRPSQPPPRRSDGSSSNSTASCELLPESSGQLAVYKGSPAPPISQLDEAELERLLGPAATPAPATATAVTTSTTTEALCETVWLYPDTILNDVKNMDQEDIKSIIDLTETDDSMENMNMQLMSVKESAGSSCDFFNDGSYIESVTCYRS